MKLVLNGKIKEFPESITLRNLVDNVASNPDRTITELNGTIVEVAKWDENGNLLT